MRTLHCQWQKRISLLSNFVFSVSVSISVSMSVYVLRIMWHRLQLATQHTIRQFKCQAFCVMKFHVESIDGLKWIIAFCTCGHQISPYPLFPEFVKEHKTEKQKQMRWNSFWPHKTLQEIHCILRWRVYVCARACMIYRNRILSFVDDLVQ